MYGQTVQLIVVFPKVYHTLYVERSHEAQGTSATHSLAGDGDLKFGLMRDEKKLHFGFVFGTCDGVKAAVKNRRKDGFAGFDSSELAALSEDLEANLAAMLAGSETPELPSAADDPDDAFAALADFVYEPEQRDDDSPETLSRQQRQVVNAAITKAKHEQGFERRGEALFHICELYLEEHGA